MSGWQERRWGHISGSGLGKTKGNKGGGQGGGGGRGGGMRRGRGRGGGPNLGPVVEQHTVIAESKNTIDFTSISGVPMGDFAFVTMFIDGLTLIGGGSIAGLVMQLSTDGGSTFETAGGYYKNVITSTGSTTLSNDSHALAYNGAGPYDLSTFISDMNQPCPTMIQNQQLVFGDGTPSRQRTMTTVAEAHDAIRLTLDINSGTPTFSSGTVYLVGYRTKVGSLQTRDFTTSPGTSWVVNIPAGHTIASIYMEDVALSASGAVRVRPSVGGTPVSGFRAYNFDSASNLVSEPPGMFSGSGVGGIYDYISLWNLNVGAPLTFFQQQFVDSAEAQVRAGMRKAATNYSQLYFDSGTGLTIDEGTIYVQTYEAKATILLNEDFSATPASSFDVTGLSNTNANAIILSSFDLTLAGSSGIELRVMLDGVQDNGSTDYLNTSISSTGDNVSELSKFLMSQIANTIQGLLGMFVGLPQPSITQMVHSNLFYEDTSNLPMVAGVRQESQVEDGFRLFTEPSNNIDGGTIYGVGYQL